MKILFICGSLEPGRDGVGDYTRRLACELLKQGNEAKIIAINDKYVQSETDDNQNDNSTDVIVLRLPASASWESRFQLATIATADFAPDWISLQFVIFTFDKRGLPFALSSKLIPLNVSNAKWHIMFHELWVGMNDQATFKLKLLGAIQKQIIYSFLKKLKPSVIHTHAFIYRYQLNKMQFNAKELPLFTNLVVAAIILRKSKKINDGEKKNKLVFSLFGGIHPNAPIDQFANELTEYAKQKEIEMELRIVGRSGNEQNRWLTALKNRNIKTFIVGELSAENVSAELFRSDYGLSTTPILLAQKSSAISTMLGHGLPVICVTKPWTIEGIKEFDEPQFIFNYEPEKLFKILDTKVGNVNVQALEDVSRQFIQDLI